MINWIIMPKKKERERNGCNMLRDRLIQCLAKFSLKDEIIKFKLIKIAWFGFHFSNICIDGYFCSQACIDNYILSGIVY